MNITLFAPHQDDEILSSYIYLKKLRQNNHISIVFATNGDYNGKQEALLRYKESVNALGMCGVLENDIYYLGYADTGMRLDHSFLFRLYCSSVDKEYSSLYSSITYHPNNRSTVHKMFFGNECVYSRQSFILDLEYIITYLSPDLIIMPSQYDLHGDHYALSLFIKELIKNISCTTFYTYLIHGEDDKTWPPRGNLPWIKPNKFPLELWEKRIEITASDTEIIKKKAAMQLFSSQLEKDEDGFLMSFCKTKELFFPFSLP